MEMSATPTLTEAEVHPVTELAIGTSDLNLWYGDFQALFGVDIQLDADLGGCSEVLASCDDFFKGSRQGLLVAAAGSMQTIKLIV